MSGPDSSLLMDHDGPHTTTTTDSRGGRRSKLRIAKKLKHRVSKVTTTTMSMVRRGSSSELDKDLDGGRTESSAAAPTDGDKAAADKSLDSSQGPVDTSLLADRTTDQTDTDLTHPSLSYDESYVSHGTPGTVPSTPGTSPTMSRKWMQQQHQQHSAALTRHEEAQVRESAPQFVRLGIAPPPPATPSRNSGSGSGTTKRSSSNSNFSPAAAAAAAAVSVSSGGGGRIGGPADLDLTIDTSQGSVPDDEFSVITMGTPGRPTSKRTMIATPVRDSPAGTPGRRSNSGTPPQRLTSPPRPPRRIPQTSTFAVAVAAAPGAYPTKRPNHPLDESFDSSLGFGDPENGLETSFESCVGEFTALDDGAHFGEIPDDELLIDDGLHHIDALVGRAKGGNGSGKPGGGSGSGNDWVTFDAPAQGAAFFTAQDGDSSKVWPPAVTPPVTPSHTPPTSAARDPKSGQFESGDDYIDRDPELEVGMDDDDGASATGDGSNDNNKHKPTPSHNETEDEETDEGDLRTLPSISTETDNTHRTNNMSPRRPGMLVSTPQRPPPRGVVSPALTPTNVLVGQSPGRYGRRLMDDDNTTIRTDEESDKFTTPQRKEKYSTPQRPTKGSKHTSPATNANNTSKDESFELQNILDVTTETATINNKSMKTTTFNDAYTTLVTVGSDFHTVGSDGLQTVDDQTLGTRVTVAEDEDDASFIVQHSTKTGSRVIPGLSGRDNKEVCGMFHEIEDFFDELADDLTYSMKDFSRKLDYLCVGEDNVGGGRGRGRGSSGGRGRSSTRRSSSRSGSKRDELKKIMNKRGRAAGHNIESFGDAPSSTEESEHRHDEEDQLKNPPHVTDEKGGSVGKEDQVKENFAC